jgi:hypothetical protein
MGRRSLASPICEASVLEEPIMLLRYYLFMEALYAEGARSPELIEGFNQVICECPGTRLT